MPYTIVEPRRNLEKAFSASEGMPDASSGNGTILTTSAADNCRTSTILAVSVEDTYSLQRVCQARVLQATLSQSFLHGQWASEGMSQGSLEL
eukprot:5417192-Amphidinium_carterae.2